MSLAEKILPSKAGKKGAQGVSTDIAVCIHAFYLDVFETMLPYLENIQQDFDLFITCPHELKNSVMKIVSHGPYGATILPVDNFGMDVVPFLRSIDAFDLTKYLAVLKLHTKNNKSPVGRIHASIFIETLLGSSELIHSIVRAFRKDPDLFIAGPHDLFRSAKYLMYNNRALTNDVLDVLGVNRAGRDWGFFAGTMFWIKGQDLRLLHGGTNDLIKLAKSGIVAGESTGRDGSLAHALERIWGAFRDAKGKVGLIYRCNLVTPKCVLKVTNAENSLRDPIRRLGGGDLLLRWESAERNAKFIAAQKCFDAKFYISQCEGPELGWMDPLLHFLLYGEKLGLNPSEEFSTVYYTLRRPDVTKQSVNVLVHYLVFGKNKERMISDPSEQDWLELAERLSLFDAKFYNAEHTDNYASLSVLDPRSHYSVIGRHLELAPSENFDPAEIPVLKSYPCRSNALTHFIRTYSLEEIRCYDELERVLLNNDFDLVPELVTQIESRFGLGGAAKGALALAYIHLGHWAEASVVLDDYWSQLGKRKLSLRPRRTVVPADRRPNEKFPEVARNHKSNVKQEEHKVCVYTALYGDIDELPSVMSLSSNCRFICFTDRARSALGWEYRLEYPNFVDSNLKAKTFKILAHRYLAEFDYSMFVDANTLLMGRLEEFLVNYLFGNDFVMWRHPERGDLYAETVAVVESQRHSPTELLSQLQSYHEEGLPRNTGLVEASFIWRRHNVDWIIELMEEWWRQIVTFTRRDQISLGYLLWKTGKLPQVLTDEIGSSRYNRYFVKLPHLKLPYEDFEEGSGLSRRTSTKDRDVWFLYGNKHALTGSTVLRGEQLCELVKSYAEHGQRFYYSSFDDVNDSILFLTKGYIAQHGVERIEQLRKKGNIILADFVDSRVDPSVLGLVDVLVASSIGGLVAYKEQFRQIRSHHITHHVDLRMDGDNSAQVFSAGYFGEIVNTICIPEIRKEVHFVNTDTSHVSSDWVPLLKNYSFHYAVRHTRSIDGYKPFLKGFVAAHYAVNMMIQRGAGDAVYYLGDDYPYLLSQNPTAGDIIECLNFARGTFNGPVWRTGLEIMREVRERSSKPAVYREFKQLIDTL